jgi:hypothetical protein
MSPEDVKRCIEVAFGDSSIQKIWEHHAGLERSAGKMSH